MIRGLKDILRFVFLWLTGRAAGALYHICRPEGDSFRGYRQEAVFRTSDGRSLPVLDRYRFDIKAGFSVLGEVALLQQLARQGALTADEKAFAISCVGQRTLTRPLEDIQERLRRIVAREIHRFLPDSLECPVPELLPDLALEKERIAYYVRSHQAMFRGMRALGLPRLSRCSRLLEIGYMSGGHSIFAFERLGFRADGIDNAYSGIMTRPFRAESLRTILGSEARLISGDMTRLNPGVDPETYDIIYSTSVLEHLQDPVGAFTEMKRLLVPGGLLIHAYHPFFSPNGGHASGTLDFPWGHVRLSADDYLKYVQELRPYEFERAREWICKALNPSLTISRVQQLLADAGLEILLWKESSAERKKLAGFSSQVISECMQIHPGITLSDLLAQSVFFVARKPS